MTVKRVVQLFVMVIAIGLLLGCDNPASGGDDETMGADPSDPSEDSDIPDDPDPGDVTPEISGVARFTTEVTDFFGAEVKLAAFWDNDDPANMGNWVMKSNVVSLGDTPGVDVPFTLTLDFPDPPENSDSLYLCEWIDWSYDGERQVSETLVKCVPNNDGGSCAVFQDAPEAEIIYSSATDCWRIFISSNNSDSFSNAVRSGARLTTAYNVR